MSIESSDQITVAIICREMKWTYDEYLDTPTEFIDTLIEMLRAEAKASKKK